jgi:hypothetical protein
MFCEQITVLEHLQAALTLPAAASNITGRNIINTRKYKAVEYSTS